MNETHKTPENSTLKDIIDNQRLSRQNAEKIQKAVTAQSFNLNQEITAQRDTLSTASNFIHNPQSITSSRRASYVIHPDNQTGVNLLVNNYNSNDPVKLQELLHDTQLQLEKEKNDSRLMKVEMQNMINNYCRETNEIKSLLDCEFVSEKHIDYCTYLFQKYEHDCGDSKEYQLEEEKSVLTKQVSELQDQLNEISEQLKLSEDQNNDILNHYSNIKKENENVVNDYNILHDKYNELKQQMIEESEINQTTTNQLMSTDEENQQLRNTINEIKSRNEQLTSDLLKQKTEYDDMQNMLQKMKIQSEDNIKTMTILKNDNDKAVNSQNIMLMQSESENNELKEKIKEMTLESQENMESMKKIIAEYEKKISEIKNNYSKQFNKQQSDYSDLEHKLTTINNELTNSKENFQQLTVQNQKLESNLLDSQNSNKTLQDQNLQLTQTINKDNSKAVIQEQNTALSNLRKQLDEKTKIILAQQNKCSEIQQSYTSSLQQAKDLAITVQELTDEKNKIMQQISILKGQFNSKTDELNILSRKQLSVQNELDRSKQVTVDLQTRNDQLKSQNAQDQEAYNQLQNELQKQSGTIADLVKQLSNKSSQLESLNTKFQGVVKQSEENQKFYANELKSVQNDKEQESKRFVERINVLNDQNTLLNKKNTELSNEIQAVRTEFVTSTNDSKRQHELEISKQKSLFDTQIKSIHDDYKAQILSLQLNISQLKSQNNTLLNQIDEFNKSLPTQLHEIAKNYDDRILHLNNQISSLQLDRDTLTATSAKEKQLIYSTNQNILQYRSTIDELKVAVKQLNDEKDILIETNEATVTGLNAKYKELEFSHEEQIRRTKEQYQKSIDDLHARYEDSLSEIRESYFAKKDLLDNENSTLQSQVNNSQNDITYYSEQNQLLEDEINHLKSKESELTNLYDQSQNELTRLQSLVSDLQNDKNTLNNDIAEYQISLQDTTTSNTKITKENLELENNIKDLKIQIKKIQSSLSDDSNRLSEYETNYKLLSSQYSDTKSDNEKLQQIIGSNNETILKAQEMTEQLKNKLSSLNIENKQFKQEINAIKANQSDSSTETLKQFKESNEQMLTYINTIQTETERLKEKVNYTNKLENENNMLRGLTIKLQNQIQQYLENPKTTVTSVNNGKNEVHTVNVQNVDSPDAFHLTILEENRAPIELSYNMKDVVNQSTLSTSTYQLDSVVFEETEKEDNINKTPNKRRTVINDYGKLIDELKNHNDILTKQMTQISQQNQSDATTTNLSTLQKKIATYETTIQSLQDEVNQLQSQNLELESDVFEHSYLESVSNDHEKTLLAQVNDQKVIINQLQKENYSLHTQIAPILNKTQDDLPNDPFLDTSGIPEIVSSDIDTKLSHYERKIRKLTESNKQLKEKLKSVPIKSPSHSESYKVQIENILEEKRNLQYLLSKFNTQLTISQHKLEKLQKVNLKYKGLIDKLKKEDKNLQISFISDDLSVDDTHETQGEKEMVNVSSYNMIGTEISSLQYIIYPLISLSDLIDEMTTNTNGQMIQSLQSELSELTGQYQTLMNHTYDLEKHNQELEKELINNQNNGELNDLLTKYHNQIEQLNRDNKQLTQRNNNLVEESEKYKLNANNISNQLNDSISQLKESVSLLNEKLIIKEEAKMKLDAKIQQQQAEYEHQISTLRSKLQSSENEKEEASSDVTRSSSKVSTLQLNLKRVQDENNHNQTLVEELQLKVTELSNSNDELQSKLIPLQSLNTELTQQVNQYQKRMEEKSEHLKINKTNNQSDILQNKLLEIQKELSSTTLLLSNAQATIAQLQEAIHEKDSKIIELENDYKSVQNTLTAASIKNHQFEMTESNFEEKMKEKENEVEQLQTKLDNKMQSYLQLTQQNLNLQSNQESLKLLSQNQDSNILVLSHQVKSLQDKIKELNLLLTNKENALNSTQAQLKAATKEAIDAKSRLSFCQSQADNKSKQIEVLEENFLNLSNHHNENDNKLTEIQEELETYIQKINESDKIINDYTIKNKELTKTTETLHKQNLDLTRQLKFKEKANQELSTCVEICKEEITSLTDDLNHIQSTYEELEQKI